MKKMKPIKRISRIIAMLIAIVMLPFGFSIEGNNAFAEQKEYVYKLGSSEPIEIYDLSGKYFFDTDNLESKAMNDINYLYKDADISLHVSLFLSNGRAFANIFKGKYITLNEDFEDWVDKNGNIRSSTLNYSVHADIRYRVLDFITGEYETRSTGWSDSREFTVKIQKKYNFYNSSMTISNRKLTKLDITNSPGTLEDCKKGEITINQNGISNTIKTGESATIAKWSSADTSIATVDQYGNVSAIENGKTIITANIFRITPKDYVDDETNSYYSLSKLASLECEITVDLYHINRTSLTLYNSEPYQLYISDQPKETRWSSSDGNVCKVDQNGIVTPISNGKAIIYCKSGNKTLKCEVTVNIKPHINKEKIIFCHMNETEQLKVMYSPNSYSWFSNDETVAVVDDKGIVKSTGFGKTVIYATSLFGDEYEYYVCNVECRKGDLNNNDKIDISDAVLLQKYLLGSQQFTKDQYEAADINQDGSTDVFDMVLMRQFLISQ